MRRASRALPARGGASRRGRAGCRAGRRGSRPGPSASRVAFAIFALTRTRPWYGALLELRLARPVGADGEGARLRQLREADAVRGELLLDARPAGGDEVGGGAGRRHRRLRVAVDGHRDAHRLRRVVDEPRPAGDGRDDLRPGEAGEVDLSPAARGRSRPSRTKGVPTGALRAALIAAARASFSGRAPVRRGRGGPRGMRRSPAPSRRTASGRGSRRGSTGSPRSGM